MLNQLQQKSQAVDHSSDYIVISPVGGVSIDMCEQIAHHVQLFFGYQTYVKSLIDNIEFAFDDQRKQYHSTPILTKLTGEAPEGILKILAVTEEDLFIPILTHVYGEAELGGTSCIISTCRLHEIGLETEETGCKRLIKEAIHELGHTFNLRHCEEKTCIMHYCRTLKDVDFKSNQYCRYCSVLLSDEMKVLSSLNLKPSETCIMLNSRI